MAVEGVYKETEKGENVYFNLKNDEPYVLLELVDKNGNHMHNGNILYIHKTTGKIHSAWNINRDIGFELDCYGSVTINQNQIFTLLLYIKTCISGPYLFSDR